ncbi:tyrosine-type recombinase/integrase [Sinorhizobium terangae]|uniref:Tyrosine-type recombinase/integrase n=1 Tax=Sinorhizobium terangae TaxID=110322 RepID=A0A6N7LJ07_SINTE|nr:tyrosine-type recombinase/integrase [Sinorhizobium terangae]
MGRDAEKQAGDFSFPSMRSGYEVSYSFTAQGPVGVVKETTLADLLQRYADILWEEGHHKYNVKAFIGELDEILFGARFSIFSQDMLDSLIGALRKRGNSNATINRKMAALSKLLRKAYNMGDIHSLPEFRRQKERAGRLRFLEADEEEALFREIGNRSQLYVQLSIFLVDTGARLGEAIALKWNDVHQGRATFWVTKSGRSRTVPLTMRAKEALEALADRSPGPFAAIDQQKYRAVWNAAKVDAGLGDEADIVPHVLRHTCASRLVRGGIDLRRVQMWLGHQTLEMTMRYAHLASHDLDMCVPVLERHLK